jgi:hypothetical protein
MKNFVVVTFVIGTFFALGWLAVTNFPTDEYKCVDGVVWVKSPGQDIWIKHTDYLECANG